jgi:hypothetical protein
LSGYGYGNTLFANTTVGPINCSPANVQNSYQTTPACMTPAEFTSPVTPGGVATFGNERRNQVYGPHFFNADLTLMKNFRIPKWEGGEFQIGAQAFNVLNHPNFDQPVGNIADPSFGYINRTVATPPLARSRFAPNSAFNCTPEHLLAARFKPGPRFYFLNTTSTHVGTPPWAVPAKRAGALQSALSPPFPRRPISSVISRVTRITTPCDLHHRSPARFPVSMTMALSQRRYSDVPFARQR